MQARTIARTDRRALSASAELATTEDKIPERPVEFVTERSSDNITGNLVGSRNQCGPVLVDYVIIEIAEIVVQIFGSHQPVADCVFKPAARRPTPPGLRLAASQTASKLRD